jgi:glycosyltransferase involved in cell wall biosynthesis
MCSTTSQIDGLSIIIPAFNEANAIGDVIQDINRDYQSDYEIIVVDDGSTDNTGHIAEENGAVVYYHPNNWGYGAALKTGIRNANYQFILITDADGTYPSKVIPDLVNITLENNNDMTVGARVGQDVSIPMLRRPAKWFISKLAQYVASRPILDVNSGLRIFKREIVLRFFNALPDGFSFTTTITLGMLINNYKIGYLPINYRPRIGRSKIRPLRDTINFVGLIFRIALYFAPLKFFVPLSGLLLLVALGWGLFTYLSLGKLADVSTIVIVMAAFQILVIGLLAELINHRLPNQYRHD